MNDMQAIAHAKAALTAWDVPACIPRLIKNRENAVFEVTGPDGTRAALRLHRPGYQTDAAIRSELVWSQGLAQSGMAVPCPLQTRDGDVIAQVPDAGRVASLVTWSEGEPLGEGGVPFTWAPDRQAQLYHALGTELALLHRISDTLSLPDWFERPRLDIDGLLGEAPLWGRFWENAALTQGEMALLQEARSCLQGELQALSGDTDFGLIHADALRENVFVQGDSVSLIDFDDGVFGFRLYDLGVAMSQNWDLPNAAELATALSEGYGLDSKFAGLVPVFTVIRALASCGWCMPRYAPNDPALITYSNRAVKIAKRYLDGKPIYGA
ncbi:phosphotransferase enzyme family protein [Profundibacter sp.]